MVYARAGIALAIFGIVMIGMPVQVIRFQQRSYPTADVDASEWRIKVVRSAGLVLLAIGLGFYVGAGQGWL